MRSSAGCLESPGMVMMSPASATMKPAPLERVTSLTRRRKPSGAPSFLGSSDSDYCVFAMQMGRLARPSFSMRRIDVLAAGSKSTPCAP